GTYENSEKYDLTETNILDTDFTDGKLYNGSLTLVFRLDGDLNYRFYASDGPNDAIGAPNNDSIVTVNNSLPVGGYTEDNIIPAAQITQSCCGTAIITINWKGRDDDYNNVTLKDFEYSVDGGLNWSAPTSGDSSPALSADWIDNGGDGYTTASSFDCIACRPLGSNTHSFTFDTDDSDVSGMAGVDQSDVQVRFTLSDSEDSIDPVTSENFRVDADSVAPTDTITSAFYDPGTNTMTITGTNFTSIASVGRDIASYVDWSKFVWDINGDDDDTEDITFAVGDITSLTVTDDTTLTLVFTADKGIAIEETDGYGPTPDDTLDVTAGFSRDAMGNAATTDAAIDASISM
ncbi:hypothetical protein ACFLYW_02925, partial [Thermodesulfobacteriota bacterium]